MRFVAEDKSAAPQRARLLAYAALNKKAHDPVILDLRGLSDLTDYFVVVSGNTDIQVRAIFQEIQRVCREHKLPIRHVEGERVGTWILLDHGDVVTHIFRQAERDFYDLEGLWHRAPRLALPKM